MLDEIHEYNQYTAVKTNPVSGKKRLNNTDNRLKYLTLIKGSFSGLERALTIIARWHIFNEDPNKEFNSERKQYVKDILKEWCGFNRESESFAWLVQYIKTVILTEALTDGMNALAKNPLYEDIQNKVDKLSKPSKKRVRPATAAKNEKILHLLKNVNKETAESISKTLLSILDDIKNDLESDDVALLTKGNYLKETLDGTIEIKGTDAKTIINDIIIYSTKIYNPVSRVLKTLQALVTLKNKSKHYNKSLFTSSFAKANDFKTITFEKIIANAYNMGKLEKYVLACDKNPFMKITAGNEMDAVRKFTPKKQEKGLDLRKADKDIILRITAYYFLQKRFTEPGQDYVVFNKSDMANWLFKKDNPDKFELEKYKIDISADVNDTEVKTANHAITRSFVPLFDVVTLGADKSRNKKGLALTKIKVNEHWLKKFQLVRCDLDKPIDKPMYYNDLGSGAFLEENI